MDRAEGERVRVLQKIESLRAVIGSIEASVAQTRSGVPCGRYEAQTLVQSAADLAFSLVALDAYVNAEIDAADPPAEDEGLPGDVAEDLFLRVKTSIEDYQGQTRARISRKLVRESVASMKGDESREVVRSVTNRLIGIFCP